MSHTIPVEFDPSMHPDTDFDSLDETSKLVFAALDTSYRLLREYAVRATLAMIREEAAEQGNPIPITDEELFERVKVFQELGAMVPVSYLDMAPDLPAARIGLYEAFQALIVTAVAEAEEAFTS